MSRPMIYVCPLSRIEETVASSGARRLVTAAQRRHAGTRPASLRRGDHLFLSMHDITEEQPDMTPPGEKSCAQRCSISRELGPQRAAPDPLLCRHQPLDRGGLHHRRRAGAASATRSSSRRRCAGSRPRPRPNIRLISIADRLLGREGRMVAAIESIGRGADAFEGVPFALKIDG